VFGRGHVSGVHVGGEETIAETGHEAGGEGQRSAVWVDDDKDPGEEAREDCQLQNLLWSQALLEEPAENTHYHGRNILQKHKGCVFVVASSRGVVFLERDEVLQLYRGEATEKASAGVEEEEGGEEQQVAAETSAAVGGDDLFRRRWGKLNMFRVAIDRRVARRWGSFGFRRVFTGSWGAFTRS